MSAECQLYGPYFHTNAAEALFVYKLDESDLETLLAQLRVVPVTCMGNWDDRPTQIWVDIQAASPLSDEGEAREPATKCFPPDEHFQMMKVCARYQALAMLPFTLVEIVPKKLWEPVLHPSFDEHETGGGGNTSWISDHCSKLHNLANSIYPSNFGAVGSAVKLIGLIPNLTASMSHTDAEPKRLRYTIVAAGWLLSSVEALGTFEREEFAEAMVGTEDQWIVGRMSKAQRLMKETNTGPVMLKKMDDWFKAHRDASKSGNYEELLSQPDSGAPLQPSLLSEDDFGALNCGDWQTYPQYETCWTICSYSYDGKRLIEQYVPLLKMVISKCTRLHADRFPVTAITKPLGLFASKHQTMDDDFDMGTVSAELMSLPVLEHINREGSSTPMEVDTLPNLTKCILCGDKVLPPILMA